MAWPSRKKQPSILTPAQLRAIMQAVFGPRNKNRFAQYLGYSPQHLDRLLGGRSPINRKITQHCHDLTHQHAVELFKLAHTIEAKIREFDASNEKPQS